MKAKARPRRALTREAIIEKTIPLLAGKGFASLSFQALADACGVSQTAILYHFHTKALLVEEVLKAIVLHNHSIVSGEFRPEDDARNRLLKHFRANLAWAVAHPDEAKVIVLLYYFASFDPSFSRLNGEIQRKARDRILEYVLAGKREGLFRPGPDAELLSETLHDALLGGIVNYITVEKKTRPDPERLQRKWALLIERLTEA